MEAKNSPLPCDYSTASVRHGAHAADIQHRRHDGLSWTRTTRTIPWSGPQRKSWLQDDIVLWMEARPVAVDQQTWGGIKALYR